MISPVTLPGKTDSYDRLFLEYRKPTYPGGNGENLADFQLKKLGAGKSDGLLIRLGGANTDTVLIDT